MLEFSIRLHLARHRFRARRFFAGPWTWSLLVTRLTMILGIVAYLAAGVWVVMTRPPADQEALRRWLSVGMLFYVLYLSLRVVWSGVLSGEGTENGPMTSGGPSEGKQKLQSALKLSPAQELWLGGGPMSDRQKLRHRMIELGEGTLVKTLLVFAMVAIDAGNPLMMFLGLLSGMLLMELCRLVVMRWFEGASRVHRGYFRIAVTAIAVYIAGTFTCYFYPVLASGSTTAELTSGMIAAIGKTASSDVMSWLAFAWWPAAELATGNTTHFATWMYLPIALALPWLAFEWLAQIDGWVRKTKVAEEHTLLGVFNAPGQGLNFQSGTSERDVDLPVSKSASENRRVLQPNLGPSPSAEASNPSKGKIGLDQLLSRYSHSLAAMVWRVGLSVQRYRWTLVSTFAIPAILCLSPLIIGDLEHPWIFVVGGIAMCTALVAPASLRIDFRRDLNRTMFLRSFPASPTAVALGQIAWPTIVTIIFQTTVLVPAALLLDVPPHDALIWWIMLACLSIIVFALENAFFLCFPHHVRDQGISVIVRTKLVFFVKTAMLLVALSTLAVWSQVAKDMGLPTLVAMLGTIMMCIVAASFASWILIFVWARFDVADAQHRFAAEVST